MITLFFYLKRWTLKAVEMRSLYRWFSILFWKKQLISFFLLRYEDNPEKDHKETEKKEEGEEVNNDAKKTE